MKEKNIALLKIQLEKLLNLKPDSQYGASSPHQVNAWIAGTKGLLERIFGKDSIKIKEIENIKRELFHDLTAGTGYDLKPVVAIGSSIIEACISEIDLLGLPEMDIPTGKGINLTMIQNQSNKQAIKIDVITNALNEELTGKQLKELQDLIDSQQKPEEKKKNIKDKLIEFGSNTLSGIIAGILTNPSLIGK